MLKLHKCLLRSLSSFVTTPRAMFCRNYSDIASRTEEKLIYSIPSFLKLPPKSSIKKQNYDYFLVLDFEATCDSPVTLVPQEIIEFPVLKVNGSTFEIESSFHSYVRPVMNPQLTQFCSKLTGITQDTIDNSPLFEDVYEMFQNWMEKENLLDKNANIIFATCGDWDLKYMFPIQCKGLKLTVPNFMKKWINVKISFVEMTTVYPRNMVTMIKYCQMEHEGRLHSGIVFSSRNQLPLWDMDVCSDSQLTLNYDCRNIARILKNLAERGMVYSCNGGTN